MKKLMPLLLFLLLLSLDCAFAYEYASPALCTYSPTDQGEPVSFEAVSYASSHGVYYFSAEIEESVRDAFIQRQEKLFEALKETGFTLYVRPDEIAHGEGPDKRLFLSPLDDSGMDQAIAALQGVYGETANYGFLFGAANALCKEAGLPGYTLRFNEKGMLKFCNNEDNLPHFLLHYPSFIEDYTDKSQIPFIKDLSVRLYQFAAEKGVDEKLLLEKDLSAFHEAFIPLVNEYLLSIEAETGLYTHLPPMRFRYGGANCPLVISTLHGDFYLFDSFSDTLYPYWYDANFSSLFSTLWRAEDELSHMDQMLGIAPKRMQFYLCAQGEYGLSGNYQHYEGEGPVLLCSLSSLSHEYAHARIQGQNENAWFFSELTATYFEMQSFFSLHDSLYTNALWDMIRSGQENSYWQPVLEAMEQGEKLNYWSTAGEIYGYLCFSHAQYDLFTPSSRTLNALRAFACYLQENYGDEKMGAAFASGDPLPVLGKTWEELQQGWQFHLEALFGEGASL